MIEEIKIDRLEELIHEMMIKIRNTSVTNSAEGNPIEIENAAAAPLVKCVTEITGSQDLHGYDKPWVGGAGKNKLPCEAQPQTLYNIKVTVNDDGTVIAEATSTASHNPVITNYGHATLGAGSYKINGISGGSGSTYYIEFLKDSYDGTRIVYITDGDNNLTLEEETNVYVRLIVATQALTTQGQSITYYPMIRLSTVTDSTFEPYSNICPITAYTEGEIEVRDGDGNTTTHTTTYPSAIYRGSEDVVNGEVTSEWGMIASYAGETLPGEWISDRDEYAPGTTPTTGAQVAYELATPTTSSVTPTNLPIKSLSGYNHIESSTGDMEVTYITEEFEPLVPTA